MNLTALKANQLMIVVVVVCVWKPQKNAFFWLLVKTTHADDRVHGIAQPEIIINEELPALREASDL